MQVSRRMAILTAIASAFLGGGVSLYISSLRDPSDHHLQLAVALAIVVLCIVGCGIIAYYQISLRLALHNQDEAQKLAGLGSWERDLKTGRGYWSKNRYRLFGLLPRKIAPSQDEFISMIHPDDRNLVKEAVSSAISKGLNYEITYRLANDSLNRVFVSRGAVARDPAGIPLKIVGTSQDVTEKIRQQKLTESLILQKNAFISRLAHDLNTPLTPLVTLLPMLMDRISDEKQLKWMDICINSVEQIRSLVASSMQFARRFQPLRHPLNFTTFPLFDFVNEILQDKAKSFAAKDVICKNSIAPSITICADHAEIEIVFAKILENAVKFSPAGSEIEVKAEQIGCSVTVSVVDHGVGLDQEELQHIFEDFYKADPSRHELGSSGLGLSICRQIVLNHGGLITAVSDGKGLGTTISFTLLAGDDI